MTIIFEKFPCNFIQCQVYVGKNLCGYIIWVPSKKVYPVSCNGAKGDSVRIVQDYDYLQLAEVQVFGKQQIRTPVRRCCSYLSLKL